MSGPNPPNRIQMLRSSLCLIGALILIAVAVEAGTRLLVPRISRIEGRIVREHAEAVRPPGHSKPVVLLLGNSLLDAAVQFERVRSAVDTVAMRRYVVERTTFYDWHYGLRRLFDEGARPHTVILMLSPQQLMANGVRGDFFANKIMRTKDIFEVAHTLKLHPTQASSMLFANASAFYGLRAEIRKVILGRLMPDLPQLTEKMVQQTAMTWTADEIRQVAPGRLRLYAEECRRHGARFVLLVAPLQSSKLSLVMHQTAQASGITSMMPFGYDQFKRNHFSDGFHMNDEGASIYTAQFVSELQQLQ